MRLWEALEAQFFHALNAFVEPAVRAGCGAPGISPSGLIVLETTGRRTGRLHRTPVLATVFDGRIVVSTSRGGRSQWLKNLSATPAARYWLGGRLHEADAVVFDPNAPAPDIQVPPLLSPLIPLMALLVNGFGAGFAVLTPRTQSA